MNTEPTAPKLTAEQIKACQQNDVPMGLLEAKCSLVYVWLQQARREGIPMEVYDPAACRDEKGWVRSCGDCWSYQVLRVSPDYTPAEEPEPAEVITVWRDIKDGNMPGYMVKIWETYGADGHLLKQTAERVKLP